MTRHASILPESLGSLPWDTPGPFVFFVSVFVPVVMNQPSSVIKAPAARGAISLAPDPRRP